MNQCWHKQLLYMSMLQPWKLYDYNQKFIQKLMAHIFNFNQPYNTDCMVATLTCRVQEMIYKSGNRMIYSSLNLHSHELKNGDRMPNIMGLKYLSVCVLAEVFLFWRSEKNNNNHQSKFPQAMIHDWWTYSQPTKKQ